MFAVYVVASPWTETVDWAKVAGVREAVSDKNQERNTARAHMGS